MSTLSKTVSFEQLDEFAKEVVATLGEGPFCLWLKGDLGAGKTTFTRFLLHNMGLDRRIPVTSPTFTYLNEYHIGEHWYAHMDLYRIESGSLGLEDIGIVDNKTYRGFIVEWPSKIPEHPVIEPSHVLEIEPSGEFERNFNLKKLG